MSSTASLPVQTPGLSLDPVVVDAPARLEAWLLREREQLIHWAPVTLGIGIATWFACPWSGERWLAAGLAAAVAVAGLAARAMTRRVVVGAGLLMLLGLGVAAWRAESVASPRLLDPRTVALLTGRVTAVENRVGRGQVRLTVAPDDRAWPPRVRVGLASGFEAPAFAPGARMSARVRMSPPPPPAYPILPATPGSRGSAPRE